MTEIKKGGNRDAALIFCAILIVILVISNVWFFIQVKELQRENEYLNSQVDSLNLQIADLKAIIDMKKSVLWVENDTTNYPPGTSKSWGLFYANHAGLVLVRVQVLPPISEEIKMINVEVKLSSNTEYVTKVGTLHLVPSTTGPYFMGTALFPVASLRFPVDLRIAVKNISEYTVQLAVTITYVY